MFEDSGLFASELEFVSYDAETWSQEFRVVMHLDDEYHQLDCRPSRPNHLRAIFQMEEVDCRGARRLVERLILESGLTAPRDCFWEQGPGQDLFKNLCLLINKE